MEEEVIAVPAHLHSVVPAQAGTDPSAAAQTRFSSRPTVGPRLRGGDDVVVAKAVRGSLPVTMAGQQVGYASTSTWSPVLKKYIALVHLQRPYYEPGTKLTMEVTVEHKRLHAPGKVVKLPFYEPEWKKK